MKPKGPKYWSSTLQTLEGHSDWVRSVAFSSDGKGLASGSWEKAVRLWDTRTGAALQTLQGHLFWINSVDFSPDGRELASGSDDKTVRLWDTGTGAALQTIEGHSGWVSSVAFWDDGAGVVGVKGDWVTIINGQKALWLPPHYRPAEEQCVAVYNSIIGIGCSSGRMFFYNYREVKKKEKKFRRLVFFYILSTSNTEG